MSVQIIKIRKTADGYSFVNPTNGVDSKSRKVVVRKLGKRSEVADLEKVDDLKRRNVEVQSLTHPDYTYQGDLKGGRPHGAGVLRFTSGELKWYSGNFVDGRPDGFGILQFSEEGRRYEGGFKSDPNCFFNFDGYGVLTRESTGYEYTGSLKNGKKDGYGTCIQGPNYYEGQWKNDQFHGLGKLHLTELNTFQEGLWENGTFISDTI